MYPRLPNPPDPAPDDTALIYGCRILQYLLESGVYCTATAEQLRAADYSAYFAVTARGILPAAVDRLSDVRHEIHDQLRRLESIAAEISQDSPAPGCAPGCDAIAGSSDSGPGNPGGRVPRRPYPVTNPPAGAGLRLPDPAPVINF